MFKNMTKRKKIYRLISAMMGLIIVVMAFSFDEVHVNAQTDLSAFPYGYRAKLAELNRLHPNWTFIPENTNLDWETVVSAEMEGNRSLVYYNVKDSWKSKAAGDYDPNTGTYIGKSGNQWVRASREAVEYHLNPINYFDEYHIFSFEQLSFNPSIHNAQGVEGIISNSWMSYTMLEDGSGGLYSEVFVQTGAESGVSPYHVASRVLQEQGRGNVESHTNQNPLISGAYGVYNYFNFGASGYTNAEIIANGVVYAEKQGWTTRYKALLGGAQKIGKDYINRGQDTLYLQKFDVDNSDGGLYWHQYMQNIQAPMSESGMTYRAYEKCGAIDQNFVFRIPVYRNMPGNEPPVSVEKAREFARRMYVTCLDREPEEKGLNDWTEALVSGQMTATDVAVGFVFGDEFKAKNYCNECYVKHLYVAFLGRGYDDLGLAQWVSALETGSTREAVFNGFVLSPEFTAFCDDCGIQTGSGIAAPQYGTIPKGPCTSCGKPDGVTEFVIRLYRLCLDRDPETSGLLDHCNLLWNHTISATDDAKGFIFSDEFISKGYDNGTYVEYLYRALMDREADEEGKNTWVQMLDSGVSREEVFYGFTYSDEFRTICNRYGIRVTN